MVQSLSSVGGMRYRAFALGAAVLGRHGGGHRNYWHRFGHDQVDLYGVSPTMARRCSVALREALRLGGIVAKRLAFVFDLVDPIFYDDANRNEAWSHQTLIACAPHATS